MAEMRRLENMAAVITGGGTGIGAAVARRFVGEGARVCLVGRRKALLEEVAKSLPSGAAMVCPGDVSSESDVDRIVDAALDFAGAINILVNNAGFSVHGAIADLPPAEWRRAVDVNLTGPFLTMHKTIPRMIEAGGGSIVNIASIGGIRSIPGAPAYCSSKAGLIMLTRQAAVDYGRQKIRCNAVCPGLTQTEMSNSNMDRIGSLFNLDRAGAYRLAVADLPLGRAAVPDEIAPLCAYLASGESSFMTGAVLVIDGGISVLDAGMLALTKEAGS